jgi:hypothetical protein
MLISPNLETYLEVKEALSGELLNGICNQLCKNASEEKQFSEFLIRVTARYLELKRANPKLLTPTQQNKLFDEFNAAVSQAKISHEKMLGDNVVTSKFYISLRKRYKEQDAAMKEMLSPYMNETGYMAGLLNNFLDLLSLVSKDAKEMDIGKEKSDRSKNYLTWWAAEIRRHWPESASISFGLGDYLTEFKGYKSSSCNILYAIIHKVDQEVTKENIETTVRKVVKTDISQNPAKFILE